MNPTPTTCIATSFEILKSEHAIGMSRSEPPATPEAPHAPIAPMNDRKTAAGNETEICSVLAAASVMTVIVIAAPFILIVEPSGIDRE